MTVADDLFNGKDLTGWHADIPAKDDNPDLRPTFIVRDGMLVSLGTPQGHLITEGKGRRILNLTDDSENPVGQWNEMVIKCVDDQVKVWVNGDLVNHGTNCTATEGQIALQAEGSEVEFRKLDITPIEKLSADHE